MTKNFITFCIIIFSIFIVFIRANINKHKQKDDQIQRTRVTPEKILEIYQHWSDQAFSGLFAAVAAKKLRNASKSVKDQVAHCSKNAKTVTMHAKCIENLIDGIFDKQESRKITSLRTPLNSYKNKKNVYQAFVQESSQPPILKKTNSMKSLIIKTHKNPFRAHTFSNQPKNIKLGYKSLHPKSKTIVQENYKQLVRRPKLKPRIYGKIKFAQSQHRERIIWPNKNYARAYNSLSYLKSIERRGKNIVSQRKMMYGYLDPWEKNSYRRRAKRNILHKSSYELKTKFADITPIGLVAKILSKTLMASKNKTSIQPWQYAVEQIRNHAENEKELKKQQKEAECQFEEYRFRGLRHENIDVDEIVEQPKKLKKFLDINRSNDPKTDRDQKLMNLFRDGVKLGYSLAGRNTSNFDEKSFKAFSPRLLSVVPEDNSNSVDLLSPSLFSLHDKGKGIEKLVSLPHLVKGFNQKDQQEWMDFIIEAAGVNEQIDVFDNSPRKNSRQLDWRESFEKRLTKQILSKKISEKNEKPNYLTKENATKIMGSYQERKINTWEKLVKNYTKEQIAELNATGYTTLTKEQLYIVYGPESPFNNSETLHRLAKVNSSEVQHMIEHDIRLLARQKSFNVRQKDIVGSVLFFAPVEFAYPLLNQFVVLTPIVFSPIIGTPDVLGPLILSPAIFTPLILSPRVLGPIILDPLLFDPIILSPMVLNPFILTPGVFVPIILNPFLLSPFILSPQVFTPVILSPLCLVPLILNPLVGSPLILSPFVLSPVILSPQFLFGIILSPYALSPNVESKLYLSTIFLSPSFLS